MPKGAWRFKELRGLFFFFRYFGSMLGLDAAANETRTATKMITFSASQKFRRTFCFLFLKSCSMCLKLDSGKTTTPESGRPEIRGRGSEKGFPGESSHSRKSIKVDDLAESA